jgi:hypothetical protein
MTYEKAAHVLRSAMIFHDANPGCACYSQSSTVGDFEPAVFVEQGRSPVDSLNEIKAITSIARSANARSGSF